jgi:GGDEF domain-containing protein
MKKCFRKNDLFFRFSGDDFVIILDPVPYAQAFEAIERFRIAVASHDFPQIDQVTISTGFARITQQDC